MGCGNSVEQVKEMKPMDLPEKVAKKPPVDVVKIPSEQQEIQKTHEEMKETKEEEKSEVTVVSPPEPTRQNLEQSKENDLAAKKKKEEQKERAAGGVITNQLSNAFQNKKLSKIQLEKENEVPPFLCHVALISLPLYLPLCLPLRRGGSWKCFNP
jgi:hypothetical protein